MSENEDKMFDTEAIYVFIGGVVVAMLTSLVGLLLTTWANNVSVKRSACLEHDKDEFFSFLQTKIIPQLPSTLAQTLREELQKSIGALGKTIGNLNETVASLNGDLKSTFEGITKEFGDNLSSNLSSMQTTVDALTESAKSYAATMQKQDEILDKLNSPAFVSALTMINDTVDRCEGVASVLQRADQMAISLIDKQESILETQDDLLEKQASAMEHVVEMHKQLGEITIESQQQLNELTSQPNKMFDYIKQTLRSLFLFRTLVSNTSRLNRLECIVYRVQLIVQLLIYDGFR